MKLNKLLAGLGAAVLTAALAVTASAADPLVVWDFSQADNTAFYNADGTVAFSVNNGTATYDADNACLNLDVEGGDPFFVLPNQGTFPAENSFVRVKYNLTDISDWSTSIYFTTDTVQWSETGHWKGFYDGDDGEWCEQTFYMTECGAWAGTITDMRLDIFDSAWAGQNAKVAYVAVFGTEADANAFDFAAWQAAGRPVTLEAAPAADAAPAAASDRVSAVAVGGAGIFTYDESDGEYWSPALTMLDKSGVVMALEDGSIVGYSDVSTYTDPANVKTMATLTPGWYEVVLCNLGTNPEWFPADVNGKVALCVRGDSTFTVKSENSMNAGAVACLIGNNCRAVELVDETGVMTGEYENVSMSVDYYTIPMCALSSDVTARLVATTADISIADAVVAVENVFFGDLELSVSHKKSAYIFLGTLEEYEANKTRTDANTVTAGGGVAVSAPAASTEAPAAEAAPAQAEGGLQNLCLGATVEVSGVEAAGYEGEWAVDGDITTRWASDYVDDAYIIIDIGQPLPIGYIELHWETASAADYTIDVSSDGESWTNVVTATGNTKGTSPWSEDCVDIHEWDATTQRFIKITTSKRNTTYGNSLWEVVARKAADTVDTAANSAYPGSGTDIPDGSVLINGDRIGIEAGWGGNAATGRDAAFDGDVNTFFDPLGTGDGWCGIDAGEEMILTKIMIHSRDAQLPRFNGGTIEGANEEDFSDAVALFFSVEEASEFAWMDVSDEIEESDNTGYRYFRYINYTTHGDVAEVELYGYAVDGSNPTYGAAAAEEAPVVEEEPAPAPVVEETPVVEEPVAEEPAAEEVPAEEPAAEEVEEPVVVEEEVVEEAPVEEAAETFDFGVIAVVAALVSAAGYAISKKR